MTEILNNVKANGDAALREYSAKFDKTTVAALQVSEAEIAAAGERLSDELKQAMAVAVKNIETFHNAQQLQAVDVETLPGVRCQQVTRPIASVGLYIPGGSAPLFHGADAGDAGAHRRLSAGGALLAAADCR